MHQSPCFNVCLRRAAYTCSRNGITVLQSFLFSENGGCYLFVCHNGPPQTNYNDFKHTRNDKPDSRLLCPLAEGKCFSVYPGIPTFFQYLKKDHERLSSVLMMVEVDILENSNFMGPSYPQHAGAVWNGGPTPQYYAYVLLEAAYIKNAIASLYGASHGCNSEIFWTEEFETSINVIDEPRQTDKNYSSDRTPSTPHQALPLW